MDKRLIVALDVDSEEKAICLAEKLCKDVKLFKVGLELFSSCGPAITQKIRSKGCGIFLDLKFHDIPNTVSRASAAAAKLGVFMFNVHALGGYEMMRQASEAASKEAVKLKIDKPKILAVTILTSMDEAALKRIGINDNMDKAVLKLARLAKEASLDGVVASPSEAKAIRKEMGAGFLIVTPGVRPRSWALGDQKRVASPKEAIEYGADYIVVGRPIIEADDPVAAAREILKEIEI